MMDSIGIERATNRWQTLLRFALVFEIVGLLLIGFFASWWTALGVFLILWARNIGERVRREEMDDNFNETKAWVRNILSGGLPGD